MKNLIFTLIAGIILVLSLTSCAGGYTCPTYLQDTQEVDQTMTKRV